MVATDLTILDRYVDFLATNPDAQEILDFKANEAEEERFAYLLKGEANNSLSVQELVEYHLIMKARHLAGLTKMKATVELRDNVRS